VSNEEAFFCVELLNSDQDGSGGDDVTEIGLGTQPGWTAGATNTLTERSGGTHTGMLPPAGVEPVDPDGTEPPPPPPPDGDASLPPGQRVRGTIVVRPGESIQAAPGTRIYVLAGVYREIQNTSNGLEISKPIRLIGQTGPNTRVASRTRGASAMASSSCRRTAPTA